MGFVAVACFAVAAFLSFKVVQDMGGLNFVASFWRSSSKTRKRVIGGVLIFALFEVIGFAAAITEGTRPLTAEEVAPQQAARAENTAHEASRPHVARMVKCEDREREEDQLIRGATGEDPILIRRSLAQAPVVIATRNGTPDELVQLSTAVDKWNAVLEKWRAQHPCL